VTPQELYRAEKAKRDARLAAAIEAARATLVDEGTLPAKVLGGGAFRRDGTSRRQKFQPKAPAGGAR
jgi:hypothetical protein